MFDAKKIILAGPRNTGKTTLLREVASEYGWSGIVSVKNFVDGVFMGYMALDLTTGDQEVFLSTLQVSQERIGPFYVSKEGLAFVKRVMKNAFQSMKTLVIDEIGMAELKGTLFYEDLLYMLENHPSYLVVVQEAYLQEVLEMFPSLKQASIYHIQERK